MDKIKWRKYHSGRYLAEGVDDSGRTYEAWAGEYKIRGARYWQVHVIVNNESARPYCADFEYGKEARIAVEIYIYFNYRTGDGLEVNCFKHDTGDAAHAARAWYGDYG